VPDAHEIEIVDLQTAASRSLPTEGIAFRSPPTVMTLSSRDGKIVGKIETCGDADDVFVDDKRHRVYVICGEGVVDVLEPREGGYVRLTKVSTVAAARTSLFVPELDRLFVAVRAASDEPAAIWVFRPMP
jgi:hypothetical protein